MRAQLMQTIRDSILTGKSRLLMVGYHLSLIVLKIYKVTTWELTLMPLVLVALVVNLSKWTQEKLKVSETFQQTITTTKWTR